MSSRSFHFVAACFATALIAGARAEEPSAPRPLSQAHAHNDYWHERPLLDALDHGFCSVEADIYLVDGKLLVGHDRHELKSERSLAALYLDPLRDRVRSNRARIYATEARFFLLVDVKSDAEATYAALHELLARYDDLLTKVDGQNVREGAVTVVVSGNRAEKSIRSQKSRYAGIDGRPADLDKTDPAHALPWISENWNNQFRWKGDGPMPEDERAKLRDYVAKAHRHGRLVRFWATPENEAVWKELLAANVDLIGTDDLGRLQRFLLQQK
ncbi:MAG: phosphatidylinositol-specific phospholipase C/glycerophosphodiester phosphodiesterase family protein [Planctomycetota bacterium]|nr:phosphatidylinositol-specific phospholipase C/glycerophosphodiester phosphodiesterase family protein [Planctomycetota bacterium]